jgi:hypothetical protein
LYAFFDRLVGHQPRDLPPDFCDGRSEFVGELASQDIREKYIGRRLPKRSYGTPILYFNC